MADDNAYFVGRKPGIHRHRQIVQPELGFHIAAADVDMYLRKPSAHGTRDRQANGSARQADRSDRS